MTSSGSPFAVNVMLKVPNNIAEHQKKTHFRSDVTSRDFAEWRTSIKTNRMCARTDLKVILKFSRNSELLCGA